VLFRRFLAFGEDVTEPYARAIEARGIPHLLVGGKTFHEREEIETIRAALAAIEWPDDELSVFATVRGALFAVGDEELLDYHHRVGRLHPFRVPAEVPSHLSAIPEALRLLADLHRRRNRVPVAETIGRLLDETRAHVGLALRQAGEQALANVLHVAELARQYELGGGISFRGFVEELREAAGSGQATEAPILEDGSDGVRLMTVHKAKGLEFPVVILADITAKLARDTAERHIDVARGVCALRLGGWAPDELLLREAEECARDRSEGIRIAYVAATRARDLLVVPAVGDEAFEGGWTEPLNAAVYPAVGRRRESTRGAGCPEFRSRDSVLSRPGGDPASATTVAPGAHDVGSHTVVWWDPRALRLDVRSSFGLRRDDLISKEVDPALIEAGLAAHDEWTRRRRALVAQGARPSVGVRTVTDWARDESCGLPPGVGPAPVAMVSVARPADSTAPRQFGARYGTLVHAMLAGIALDATAEDTARVAALHGRVFGASDEEVASAAAAVSAALADPIMARARSAVRAGRLLRETPVTLQDENGALIEGVLDLAFGDGTGWTVVDFKTDREMARDARIYERQLLLYRAALARVFGEPVSAVLIRL
jgi:ATP-dependent exoDNAse (exonuclease V) beta subunit